MRSILIFLSTLSPFILFCQITENIKKVNHQNGYVYVGASTFLNVKLYKVSNGRPQVLSLFYADDSPTPLLVLTELDCKNRRIMRLAYKDYEYVDEMPTERYLFEHLKKWVYAESRSKELIMLNCVCVKYGYWDKPIDFNE